MAVTNKTFQFLKELKKNNNREWFHKNKERYQEIKEDFEEFIGELLLELVKVDKDIIDLTPKDCIYRIYRDTRFSKNKTPYKTNIGAHIVPGGRKTEHGRAGYYVHFEPGNCFLAGGAFHPPSPWLSTIRENIVKKPKDFKKIINSANFKKTIKDIRGEKLKSAPRDYPKDHPEIKLLRYKSFIAIHNLPNKTALSPNYIKYILKTFKTLKPFDDFLNRPQK